MLLDCQLVSGRYQEIPKGEGMTPEIGVQDRQAEDSGKGDPPTKCLNDYSPLMECLWRPIPLPRLLFLDNQELIGGQIVHLLLEPIRPGYSDLLNGVILAKPEV